MKKKKHKHTTGNKSRSKQVLAFGQNLLWLAAHTLPHTQSVNYLNRIYPHPNVSKNQLFSIQSAIPICAIRLQPNFNNITTTTANQTKLNSCPFDYVKVYDGPDNSSALIGTYCGQQRNLVLYSSESSLFVHFYTLSRTANTQNRGFKGIYEFSESFVKLDFIRKYCQTSIMLQTMFIVSVLPTPAAILWCSSEHHAHRKV